MYRLSILTLCNSSALWPSSHYSQRCNFPVAGYSAVTPALVIIGLLTCTLWYTVTSVNLPPLGYNCPRSRNTQFLLWVWQRPHLCTSQRESNILQREWSGDIYYSNGTDSSRGVAILFTPRFHYMLLNSLEPNLSPTYYNILGGDFNCIVHPVLDKQGGDPTPRQSAL